MEIKATLEKPFADKEKMDFIVTNNHKNGYQIKETDTALEAWGYTEEEKAEQAKQSQITELVAQLDAIDLKTIRPLRAIQAEQGTQADLDKLAELETQAEEVRQQIRELQGA